jgi:hypothetical protein
MKCVVEMGSGAMIYISSFVTVGSGIQKFGGGGDHRQQGDVINPTFILFKLREVG